jgi:copper chaperone
MIAFEVNDMTCGHCVSTITKALNATDPDAKVRVDLAAHRVNVERASADAGALAQAIKGAGYTPVLAEAAAAEGLTDIKPVVRSQSHACCCSCRSSA